MMSQSPQWPDEPARPDQSRGGGSPLARLARSQRDLTVIAMVTGLLIVPLLGMLALALSSNAHGAQAKNGQSGQTQSGQAANAGNAQTATAGGGGNGVSSGGSTQTTGGGASGGGGTHPTPTPTSSRGSTTPTPTSSIVTGGCCLTFTPAVHQVASRATLSGASVGPVYASCPSGEIALSGGWAIPPDPGDNVFRSQRAGAGNWAVYVKHASSVTVKTYAECLANASGATIAERLTQVSIEAKGEDHDFATATASCNAGEVVIGGGFAASSGDVEISGTYMAASGQWQAFAVNHGASSALLNAYAECLTYRGARSSMTRIKLPGTSVAKDTTGSAASYPCPSGAYVSGGGYGYNAAQGLIYDMSVEGSGSSATWTVYLRYNGDGSGSLYPYAMCLGF